jgi:hypothetical protein
MTEMTRPNTVHLVGSIGLDTVEDVFRTVTPRMACKEPRRVSTWPAAMLRRPLGGPVSDDR